jgi:cytochrome c biogenesis protein CcmG, thiol:disulfide interchange protein DsbE
VPIGVWQPCPPVGSRTLATVLVLTGALVAGCGATPRSAAPAAPQLRRDLAGSPPPLAGLHARANQLLSGGLWEFRSQLAALRGYPVVVNKWASWCGPCQSEFPVFQRVGAALGRRVAFLGIDGKDSTGAAAAFLRRFPVSYPSFNDPSERIAHMVEAATYYPQTVFINRRGQIVFAHAGPYESATTLETDIRRYLLG